MPHAFVGDQGAPSAAALADRFKLEDEAKAVDPKALWEIKKQVCRDTLNQRGMLSSNPVILGCVLKIQKALLPPEWVTWKESDNLKIRKRAYDDLVKKLK